jgi:hypothetical protein
VAADTVELARGLAALSADPLAGTATTQTITYLRELFTGADALGALMAGRAEELVGDPAVVAASAKALAAGLLDALAATT